MDNHLTSFLGREFKPALHSIKYTGSNNMSEEKEEEEKEEEEKEE